MRHDQEYRVLLVDDDPDVLYLLRRHLAAADASFEVLSETNPVAAYERFEAADRLDCIVSDYRMPAMSGLELLRAVRERDPELPFVLLTGRGNETVASEAINAGVTRYVTKDGNFDGLVDAVEEVVTAHEERRYLRDHLGFLGVVVSAIDDVVFVVDRNGHPVYWSETATCSTDVEAGKASTALDFFPPDEHESVERALRRVRAEGRGRLTADLRTEAGDRVPHEFTAVALRDDEGAVVGVCGVGRDVAEREAYERSLEALHRTSRRLLTATTHEEVARLVANATRHIVDNPVSTVYLAEGSRLVPVGVTEAYRTHLDDPDAYDVEETSPVARAFRTGDSVESDVRDVDGGRDWGAVECTLAVALGEHGVLVLGWTDDSGFEDLQRHLVDVLGASATAALERCDREALLEDREEMLATLHDSARRFIRTASRSSVVEVTLDAARTLDAPLVCVYRWEGDDGTLYPASVAPETRRLYGDLPSVSAGDGPVWRAFVTGDPARVDDETPLFPAREDVAASGVVAPIGDVGALVIAAPGERRVDESVVEFARSLASNTRNALERIEREETLRLQEERLETQNERLRRLNRINSIIRSINTALVRADSHAEIRRAVCDHLTDADHYRFAWVGHWDDTLVVDAWDGAERAFLDVVRDRSERQTEEETPVERVAETGETSVVGDVLRDASAEAWRTAALARGLQSVACLPLRYDGQEYGFLEVYGDRVGVFTEEEVTVLEELADDIANAMHAVDRKTALVSGQTTELEFELGAVDGPLFHLSRRTGGRFVVDSLAPRDGAWRVYLSSTDVGADAAVAAADDIVAIDDATLVRRASDRAVLGVDVVEFPVVDTLANYGATLSELSVEPGGGRATVSVPPSTDVRDVVEACRTALEGATLVRRAPATDAAGPTYGLADVLTARQFEVLQAAYYRGYFEWPREQTGEEVATTLDISGPTFQQHVRKGLRRLLEDAFGDDVGASP